MKLFSIDEDCIQDDLAELQKRIDRMSGKDAPDNVPDQASETTQHV